jgi:release factor glutamine methyltransferase
MTFAQALRQAKDQLREANKELRVAELLLMHVSNVSNAELYASLPEEMPIERQQQLFSLVGQHINLDVPLQHLTGEEIFFGYAFQVNSDVLIPRFETEELVERVLALFDEHFAHPVRVVDLGTGSGAIAISLAKEELRMHVDAVDVSPAALKVAAANAQRLGASVTFLEGSWCEPLTMMYDIVVANPPYIPVDEELPPMIVQYEPHVALFGGADGLDHYRTLYRCIKSHLKPRCLIAVEHGFQHAQAVQALAQAAFPAARVWSEKDLQHKDRFTFVLLTQE